MAILFLGLALFILVHLIPVYLTGLKGAIVGKVGRTAYRGLFSLVIIGSIYVIYLGWTSTDVAMVYSPPTWAFHATPIFVLIGFVLFFASQAPTNIRRMVRHPQLTGVTFWAVGHLLANGENRSVLLFGALLVWAVVAAVGSNRRDGAWVKPEKQAFYKDIVTVLIGVVAFVGFAAIHEWLIGVNPMPYVAG
ncbi:NnrU family protein [Kordiimonas aestuarii]|uniref:NnrU family protein n=1 Tax=Kordiimonas aestuarii TaxID=1005925 RepID=UPI0021CE9388|nr:NnrU family protein [Kordiimonas aestuarii]